MTNVPASGPTSVLRRVGGPLVLYHALILLGAAVLIHGLFAGTMAWEWAGAGLVVAGIGVEVGILLWSAGLSRQAGRSGADLPARSAGPESVSGEWWLCVSCGRLGPFARASICPRCGHTLIPWENPASARPVHGPD
jgi:hypothetical protein